MSADLLPCPFCGNDDVKLSYIGSPVVVFCQKCGGTGPGAYSPFEEGNTKWEKACTLWNRRISDAERDRLRERVRVLEGDLRFWAFNGRLQTAEDRERFRVSVNTLLPEPPR